MTLSTVVSGDGTPVTFLHGFTQTRTSWLPVTGRIDGISAVLVDAPGHGMSTDGRRSLWQCADDIAGVMPAGTLVGYSMGARMALHTALSHAEKVERLVLVSGTPGIEDPAERAERRASDDRLADRIESIGVAAFIDEWLANPMFSGLTEEAAMKSERLTNTAAGLADSLRHAGTGTQDDLWPRLGEIGIPVLVVHGSEDAKFAAIAGRMAAALPHGTLASCDGSGHTVHLENTEWFVSTFRDWLARTGS